jgi:hypothetical protein
MRTKVLTKIIIDPTAAIPAAGWVIVAAATD